MNREIEARLKITAADRTGRTFNAVAGKLDQVNRRAAVFNERQASMARTSAAALGVLARFGGPAAIAAGAVYATKQAGDFEQALFNIQKRAARRQSRWLTFGRKFFPSRR